MARKRKEDSKEFTSIKLVKIEFSKEEWLNLGFSLFGSDQMEWKFVCPSCGTTLSIQDYIEANAPEASVAYSCVGLYSKEPELSKYSKNTFLKSGGPCTYSGGGYFDLNPVKVKINDHEHINLFDFYRNGN